MGTGATAGASNAWAWGLTKSLLRGDGPGTESVGFGRAEFHTGARGDEAACSIHYALESRGSQFCKSPVSKRARTRHATPHAPESSRVGSSPQPMPRAPITFATIDLDAHAAECLAFRRDAFLCSFGEDGFLDEAGPEGATYFERIRSRIDRFPDGYVHVWRGDRIVGQLEMRVREEPRRGYIGLFYLAETERGSEAGAELHAFAMSFMRRHQVSSAQLSVSPTNARAMAYYRKHGWRDLGLRPGRDDVHLMEREVVAKPSDESDSPR